MEVSKQPAGMSQQADARGSEQVIQQWLGKGRTISREDLKTLLDVARDNGGELVEVVGSAIADDPDDWCGTMWFHKHGPKIGGLLDTLIDKNWFITLFPRGIPVVNAFEIQVRNRVRR
jgi:hypothetical protein